MKNYHITYKEAGKTLHEIVESTDVAAAIRDLNGAWPLPVEPLEILSVSVHGTLEAAVAERDAAEAQETKAETEARTECDHLEELFLFECEMNEVDPDIPGYRQECQDRFRNIRSMHEIMQSMNDEAAYSRWIYTVPDCPDDSDFMFIACDEESFADCVKLFKHLYSNYIASGLYIGGKLY